MKNGMMLSTARLLMAGFFYLAALPSHAQYTFNTNGGSTITITDYTGPGGAVNIPGVINGHPVTSIEFLAFFQKTDITSVTIPRA